MPTEDNDSILIGDKADRRYDDLRYLALERDLGEHDREFFVELIEAGCKPNEMPAFKDFHEFCTELPVEKLQRFARQAIVSGAAGALSVVKCLRETLYDLSEAYPKHRIHTDAAAKSPVNAPSYPPEVIKQGNREMEVYREAARLLVDRSREVAIRLLVLKNSELTDLGIDPGKLSLACQELKVEVPGFFRPDDTKVAAALKEIDAAYNLLRYAPTLVDEIDLQIDVAVAESGAKPKANEDLGWLDGIKNCSDARTIWGHALQLTAENGSFKEADLVSRYTHQTATDKSQSLKRTPVRILLAWAVENGKLQKQSSVRGRVVYHLAK